MRTLRGKCADLEVCGERKLFCIYKVVYVEDCISWDPKGYLGTLKHLNDFNFIVFYVFILTVCLDCIPKF